MSIISHWHNHGYDTTVHRNCLKSAVTLILFLNECVCSLSLLLFIFPPPPFFSFSHKPYVPALSQWILRTLLVFTINNFFIGDLILCFEITIFQVLIVCFLFSSPFNCRSTHLSKYIIMYCCYNFFNQVNIQLTLETFWIVCLSSKQKFTMKNLFFHFWLTSIII